MSSLVKTLPVKIDGGVFVFAVSNDAPAATPPNTLGPPGTLEAVEDTQSIRLEWEESLDDYGVLAGYAVYRKEGTGDYVSLNLAGLIAPEVSMEFHDRSVSVGITYTYYVVGVDIYGREGSPSNTDAVTYEGDPVDEPPDTPGGLIVTARAAGNLLDWDNNVEGDLAGYRVYRSYNLTGPFTLRSSPVTSTFDDTTADELVPTYYRVTAIDTGGNESIPASISATRPSTPQGSPVKISSVGTMSPCAIHVYATTHGGKRYTNPSIGVRAGLGLSVGTELDTKYRWQFLESDGATPNGEYSDVPGFNAAHLFVNSGATDKAFKVRLTVTDKFGASQQYTSNIIVKPNTRTKIYVDAQAGNDAANGLASGTPKKTLAAGLALINGPDKELRLAETSSGGNHTYGLAGTKQITWNNVVIDSYVPSGRTNTLKPLVAWTKALTGTDYGPFFRVAGKHCVIQNLRIDVPASPAGQSGVKPRLLGMSSAVNVTVNNVQALSIRSVVEQAIPGDPAIQANDAPDGVLIQNCTGGDQAWDFYFAYVVGSNWCFYGNTCYNPEAHCIRIAGCDNVSTYQNNLKRRKSAKATGERTTITDHSGRYHWHAKNHIYNEGNFSVLPVESGDGSAGYATRADRVQHVVVEDNIIEAVAGTGSLRIGHGADHVCVRNNIFLAPNCTHISINGYSSRYGRGTTDILILNNTGSNDGTSGRFLKVQASAARVVVRNNAYRATRLTSPACAVEVSGGLMTCFASPTGDTAKPVDRNVWPATLLKGGIAWPNVMKVNAAEKSLSAWNAYAEVGGDVGSEFRFASQSGGQTYKVLAGTTAASHGRPTAGVYKDYYGIARSSSASTWAAGAAEA